MTTVTKTFDDVGVTDSIDLNPVTGAPLDAPVLSATYAISASDAFVASLVLERQLSPEQSWLPVAAYEFQAGPYTIYGPGLYRFHCSAYTSGSPTVTLQTIAVPGPYDNLYDPLGAAAAAQAAAIAAVPAYGAVPGGSSADTYNLDLSLARQSIGVITGVGQLSAISIATYGITEGNSCTLYVNGTTTLAQGLTVTFNDGAQFNWITASTIAIPTGKWGRIDIVCTGTTNQSVVVSTVLPPVEEE